MSDASEFHTISLLDRSLILDQLARYSWAFDGGDLDAYLKLFFEDAVFGHPKRDGSPGSFVGHDGIRSFFGENFTKRPEQTFGHQHQFSAPVLTRVGEDVELKAYVCVFRHEFHRLYWPHGPSWRMGTWHAVFGKHVDTWKLRSVDVRMWTDTAFSMGTAIERRPGEPGIR